MLFNKPINDNLLIQSYIIHLCILYIIIVGVLINQIVSILL